MYNPVATYRLQFHKNFTFSDFEHIIPYLQKLGVSTIYASPVFEAVPGSIHGYDVLNPNLINPEIGTEEQLKELSNQLRQQNIGWLQDIVPNHMAFHCNNYWLMDVLEKGTKSLYASFFDITWNSLLFQGRLMVPFLGNTLEQVIKNRELIVALESQHFVFKYFGNAYPLSQRSYATILRSGESMPMALEELVAQLQAVKQVEEAKAYSAQWGEFLMQLNGLVKNETIKKYIDDCLNKINKQPEALLQITDEQVYRLCHWQQTDQQINYRRFFTVNGLICLNIQNNEVLEHHHQLIKKLVEEGIFQGLRIDHIDGLYQPAKYLNDLRRLAGDKTFIVAEKILEPGETLPDSWPLQGNTGYDFLCVVNNLFTQRKSEEKFTRFYQRLTGNRSSIPDQLYEKKESILLRHMGGELKNLYHLFLQLNLAEKKTFSRFRKEDLKNAIAEFLIQCPVYRYYGDQMPLPQEEAKSVQHIINRMRRSNFELSPAIELIETVFLRKPHEGNNEYNKKALHFYQRCMQFTGPLMAKGFEDTLMYTYNRFMAHNEVGDSPEAFGLSIPAFHEAMIKRQAKWPLSLNATATHDTKRGEDVRARLNVLSDIAGEWIQTVEEWQRLNKGLKVNGIPDANDEYFIYQSLAGAYPMPGENDNEFSNRIQQYVQKALREGKRHSNWTTPNEEYESATKKFVAQLVVHGKPFWKSFQKFLKKIVDFGIINSLSQVLLKFACPGTPDVYQGCELWDLSFVDPDNRRAVDYDKRLNFLKAIEANEQQEFSQELWQNRYNGQIKLWLTRSLCKERQQYHEIFSQGEYLPLTTKGAHKDHLLAFARRYQQLWYIAALPLHTAELSDSENVLELDWKDTRIVLPKNAPKEWKHQLLNTKDEYDREIYASHLFAKLPLAFLKGQTFISERCSGIILHISSLPSPFGIGDMGPEARIFADFLNRTNQRYWQILPLNPTEAGQGNSPYSSISSRAGNTLFISPELLVEDGLLLKDDLVFLPQENKVDYTGAECLKSALFEKAWVNYSRSKGQELERLFKEFCEREKEWLPDFAMYAVLKQRHNGRPWYQWRDEYKFRKPEALIKIFEECTDDLEKSKFLQFLFSKQWHELKQYCNQKGISLMGDMPYYVSYDSVDLWSHKDIFSLNESGDRIGVAGVPPDAFSDDGQLWGMPVFKWDVLKQDDYKWWVERLRKNKELFDLIRLDHFRAFAAYWEVPANEATAKNGQWKPGPGAAFFTKVEEQLGKLPFVAEDLGEIDNDVYELRDAFKLPGMKVLQFAFDENMPTSDHIPHNYTQNFVAYTGTHDNNTSKGWFRQNANNDSRRRLEQYAGKILSEEEVPWSMARMIYGSVANIVILPLQDVLGLDETARMNTPALHHNNWGWRLQPGQLTIDAEARLKEWAWLYNRG